ncbi:TIR domain-containing protein [Rhodococcus daqingensis]|uniref:TIR domain-containing protein n=1 Tax=Rhodococcus daqingensis TaxID=2479363 RepID=A0ABW2S683_9NOCA
MSRVFLSHSRRDNRHAIALKRWLEQAEPGLADEIYLDLDPETGIQTGMRWTEALWQVNARCEAVICLLSSSWATSAECHAEYRQAEGMHKPIFCARIEAYDENDVTRAWQSCDLFGDGPAAEVVVDGDEQPVRLQVDGLHRLLAGLRAAGIGADSFAWPPPGDPDRSPYRGWQPLESVDAAVYFGRDAQIMRALDELREMRVAGSERMFVILGPSGVGKSSFLRAGLLPRLRRDDRRFLTMTVVRPQRHTLTGETGLARSIHDLRKEVGLIEPSLGEIKNAISDDGTVRAWLAEAAVAARNRLLDAPASTTPPTLVLPLDQTEELFGADAGEEGPAFLELLGWLLSDVDSTGLDMIVVATIRSDRYEPLQTAPQLSAVQSHLFDRLKAMPQAQFTEVICGPARRAAESGSRFDLAPELVDRLAKDASGGADTLPLLALTLSRLYEDYAGGEDAVTVDRYEAMGGMRRVVQNEIDNLLSADPAERSEQLDRLHDAFIPWLATVNSDTDQPMRRIARWADLPEHSHALLNAFIGRRLLVKGERDGQIVVEAALESLLHQWDELAGWLRAESSDLRDADATERAVVAWERSGRHDDWLLDGERLARAETLSARPGFGARLNPAGEFLLASRRRVNERLENEKSAAEAHARSLRRRSQVLAALLAVIVVVAAVAVINLNRAQSAEQQARQQAQEAIAANLVGQSRAMLGGARLGGDRRAIQQMLAAETLAPGSDPDALLNTLIDTRRLVQVITAPSDVNGVAISPDGRLVLSAGDDGLIRRWDLESGEPVGDPLEGHSEKALGAEYTRNGQWIAAVAADKSVRIWDAHTGAAVHMLTGLGDDVSSIAISPDGALLATGHRDGTARLWKVETGEQLGEPIRGHNGWVYVVAFSPDGSRLATGGVDGAVRLWHVSTHLPAAPPLPTHKGPVVDVEFSPDGRRIASMSYLIGSDPSGTATLADGAPIPHALQLNITDADTGRPFVDGLTEFGYGADDLAFSPDGRRVAIGGPDGRIRVRDADTGVAVGPPLSGHTDAVKVAYSRDGTRIISGGDNTIHVWAAEPDQRIGTRLPGLASAGFAPAAVSPDGRIAATRDAENESDIALWRIDTGELVRTIATGHVGYVSALAWRPDGQAIASADVLANTARIWDAQTGEPESPPLTGPATTIAGLTFSRDGHRLAASGGESDPWLWDVGTRPPRGRALPVEEDFVSTVGFSADGHRLITVAPTHFASGDPSRVEETGNVFDSPEMTPSAVRVWDTDTGEPAGPPVTARGGRVMDLAERGDEVPISAAAISPDGQRVLVSTTKGLRLHDVATGELVGEPWIGQTKGDESVGSVAFSPDGTYAVSAGTTSQLQLWEVQAARPVGNPMGGHTGSVIGLAFTGDGRNIVSRGVDDGWVLSPGPSSWRDELCDKLTANMTRAEWDEWVSPTIEYRDPYPCPLLDVPE